MQGWIPITPVPLPSGSGSWGWAASGNRPANLAASIRHSLHENDGPPTTRERVTVGEPPSRQRILRVFPRRRLAVSIAESTGFTNQLSMAALNAQRVAGVTAAIVLMMTLAACGSGEEIEMPDVLGLCVV